MTESEFVQITTSFGLYPEMRWWSLVLAAYTSQDYNTDWIAMYDNVRGAARINGYNTVYVTTQSFKNIISKVLLKRKRQKLNDKLLQIKQDF